MPAEDPRVLITGAGGPSGISILRALAGTPLELLAGDIDPYGAGLYIVDGPSRWILRRPPAGGTTPSAHDVARDVEEDALLGGDALEPQLREGAQHERAGGPIGVARQRIMLGGREAVEQLVSARVERGVVDRRPPQMHRGQRRVRR